MFELEGTQFDLSQMQIWAQEAGLSVQDYADKYGFKKVGKQTPETNPAIVEGETMELPQADSLLESELQAKEPKYKIKDGGYYSKTELVEEYPELADENAFQRYANKYFEREEDGQAKVIGPMAGNQLEEVVVSKEIDRFKEERKQAEEVDNKEAEELFANDYTSTEMYYPPVAGAKGVEVEKESNKIRKQFLAANENDLSKAKEAYLESKKEGRLANIIEQKLLTSEDEELKQFGETLAKTGQKIEKEDIVLEAFKERKLSNLLSNSTSEVNRIVSQDFQTQEEVDAAKEDLKYQGAVQGAIIKKYNEVHNNINEKLKGLQDEQEILDVVKRDYDPLSIVAANLAAFSAETTSSLIALPQWLTKTRDQVIKELYPNRITNEDFAKKPIYKETSPFDPTPPPNSQLYWSTTSPSAKWIAQALNSIDGSNIEAGTLDVSPDVLQYWVEYLTGGVGRFVQRTGDLATVTLPQALTDGFDEEMVRQIPFGRKLVYSVSDREDLGRFIEKRDRVLQAREVLMDAMKRGDQQLVQSTRRKYADELRVAGIIKSINNGRNRLLRQMAQIKDNPRMPEEQKKAVIERLSQQVEALVKRGNIAVKDL